MDKNNEVDIMNNNQYIGVLNLLAKLIREDVPKEKLLEYIEELKNTKQQRLATLGDDP